MVFLYGRPFRLFFFCYNTYRNVVIVYSILFMLALVLPLPTIAYSALSWGLNSIFLCWIVDSGVFCFKKFISIKHDSNKKKMFWSYDIDFFLCPLVLWVLCVLPLCCLNVSVLSYFLGFCSISFVSLLIYEKYLK